MLLVVYRSYHVEQFVTLRRPIVLFQLFVQWIDTTIIHNSDIQSNPSFIGRIINIIMIMIISIIIIAWRSTYPMEGILYCVHNPLEFVTKDTTTHFC